MVVAFRTRQLLKRGQHAIVRNFTLAPDSNALAIKCYNQPKYLRGEVKLKVRLCEGRRFHSSREARAHFAKLTPQEVDIVLRANEYSHEFAEGPVKSYDSNQLASNNPIEDTRTEASFVLTGVPGLLMCVYDGHGGGACAQVISKRLHQYIAASLLPHDLRVEYRNALAAATSNETTTLKLVETFNDRVQFVEDVRSIYHDSFVAFLQELCDEAEQRSEVPMKDAMERAFLRLDADLSKEALPADGQVNMKTLSVAMSGAVACVAHIQRANLHVAHVGDCNAVLGTLAENGSWTATKLTHEHNTYNAAEVERILKEHPHSESNTVLRMERLLGQLAPLRALGDFRYKWSKETMRSVVAKYFGDQAIPPHYLTPPYLSAVPEITHHRLTSRDKFLVLASDGLWDIVSPLQVVQLVGEHMKGKVTLKPFKLPRKNMTLGEIDEMLLQRKEGLKSKPKDSNAATHLIRHALGGTEYGIDNAKLSQLLSLPDDVVRVFRDDITITIVYFDSEHITQSPP